MKTVNVYKDYTRQNRNTHTNNSGKIISALLLAGLLFGCGSPTGEPTKPTEAPDERPDYSSLATKNQTATTPFNEKINKSTSAYDKSLSDSLTYHTEMNALMGTDKTIFRGYTGRGSHIYYSFYPAQVNIFEGVLGDGKNTARAMTIPVNSISNTIKGTLFAGGVTLHGFNLENYDTSMKSATTPTVANTSPKMVAILHAPNPKDFRPYTVAKDGTIGDTEKTATKTSILTRLQSFTGEVRKSAGDTTITKVITYGRYKDKNPYGMDNAPIFIEATPQSVHRIVAIKQQAISTISSLVYAEPEFKNFIITTTGYKNDNGNYVRTTDSTGMCNQNGTSGNLLNIYDFTEFCVAMPNGQVINGSTGTSNVAKSRLAGVFGILRQRFPNLTTQELRKRILATASHTTADNKKLRTTDGSKDVATKNCKNQFINGKTQQCSDEFGRGSVRLDEAFKPIGQTKTVSYGDNLKTATLIPTRDSFIQSSPIFGDGFSQGVKDKSITVFDELDAKFHMPLTAFTSMKNNNTKSSFDKNFESNQTMLQNNSNQNNLLSSKFSTIEISQSNDTRPHKNMGFVSTAGDDRILMGSDSVTMRINNTFTIPYDSSSGNTPAKNFIPVTFASTINKTNTAIMHALESHYIIGRVSLSPSYKGLFEKGALLGTKSKGAFNMGVNSVSHFAQLKFQTAMHISTTDALELSGFVNQGRTKPYGKMNGMIDSIETIKTSAMGLYLNKKSRTNTLGFGVSAPIRVTSAPITLRNAITYDKSKNLRYQISTIDAKPSGLERNIEAFYSKHSDNTLIKTSLNHTIDKNHIAGNNETSVNFIISKQF